MEKLAFRHWRWVIIIALQLIELLPVGKKIQLVTHREESSALVAVLVTRHRLLFYICVPAVAAGAGGHDIVKEREAVHCT